MNTLALASHKTSLLYFAAGQIGWFACVLSAARGYSWVGVALVLVFVAWHIWHARGSVQELKLIASVAIIGTAWESMMKTAGLLGYPHDSGSMHVAPDWIIALWVLFAAQLNVVYAWLKRRLTLAALLGAIAGPLSFRAGASLHAVRFEAGWHTAVVIAIGWAFLLPIAMLLSRRWNGVGSAPAPTPPSATALPQSGI